MTNLVIFSAGSFRFALSEIAAEFTRQFHYAAKLEFAPAGLLRQRIEAGELCDIFISANENNVAELAKRNLVLRKQIIALNRLSLTTPNFPRFHKRSAVDILLDPTLRLATSTPKADPCGDYAWQLFDLLAKTHPKATALKARALQLVGGNPKGVAIPNGEIASVYLLKNDYADVMLGYAHYAEKVRAAGFLTHYFPQEWDIKAHYVAAQLSATASSQAFFRFLQSPWTKEKIKHHGFLLPNIQTD